MILTIDKREKDLELVDLLTSMAIENGYEVEMDTLTVGDYVWHDASICCEHKSTKDFLSSLTSGHLYSQLRDMAQYRHPYLFIEGPWDYHMMIGHNRLSQKVVAGMLAGVMWHFPFVQIFHWQTQTMMCQAVISIRNRADEEAPKVDVMKRCPSKTMTENPNLAAFMSVPSIGKKKAEGLLKEYTCFAAFLLEFNSDPTFFQKKGNTLPKKAHTYLQGICGL
jgi:ERCC4-type nuclease